MTAGPVRHHERVRVERGVELFVTRLHADGQRTLLVVHGGPDWDHSYLLSPLDRLGSGWNVVLPDLRGCGRSTTGLVPAAYTPDAVVCDLLALLDHVGVRQAAVLGFSYGGLIAQRLTVTAPDRVSHLIVASSSVLPVAPGAWPDCPERQRRTAAEAAVWADPDLGGAELVRAAALAGVTANIWREEVRPIYLDRIRAVRFTAEWLAAAKSGTLPSARVSDPVGALAATGVPVLLLHGRQDMTFPATLAERTAKLLDGATVVVLDNAGHMAHIDQPEAWLKAIATFFGVEDVGE